MDTNWRASSLSHSVQPRRRRRWWQRYKPGSLLDHYFYTLTDVFLSLTVWLNLAINIIWLLATTDFINNTWFGPSLTALFSQRPGKGKKSFYFQSHEITHCSLSAYDYWTKFVILVELWVMDNYRGVYCFGIFIINYSNNQTKLWQQLSWHLASVLQGGWVPYFS